MQCMVQMLTLIPQMLQISGAGTDKLTSKHGADDLKSGAMVHDCWTGGPGAESWWAPSNCGQAGPPGQSFAWLLKPGFDKLEQFNKEKTATIFMI